MASLVVILIILGCVAYQYLKGTLVKAFATIVITICASIGAFGYFEILANVFISRGDNSRLISVVPWAQTLSFVLLFVLTFGILQTIAALLTRQQVDFGLWPERIGRVVCGAFLGLILSGLLLTALAMAPLPNKWPYQRFDRRNPNVENPRKVFPNADGFVTGWFSIISRGSFSGKKSFATLHPDLIDQLFLNRNNVDNDVSIVTSSQAIEITRKRETPPCWFAREDTKDSNGNPLQKSRHNLTIARVGIKRSALKTKAILNGGTFTLSQLRLVCKQEGFTGNALAGKGKNIYPIGYLTTAGKVQKKRLSDQIKLKRSDFDDRVKWIDFAFYVPSDSVPVLVEFKQNSIAELPPPVAAEQAPPSIPFI
ncbi:MAG: hypothetical protein ACYTEO_15760 [Planctomycetota bacterium]|jgi:hypothetical protein